MKILIIDDEYYIVEDILKNTSWEKLGINHRFVAYSASTVRKIISDNPDIDIVLSDIELPQESGFDLINWIYQQGLSPVVIILTGHERFSYAHTAIELHVHSYLTKPVDIAQLEHALLSAIKESKRRRMHPELFAFNQNEENLSDPVDIISDCIRRNLSSPDLNRQLIANVVHMNQDYISTLFRKKRGTSLTSFIITERLKAAKIMLATTDYSLQEISYKTGFSSISYFHRQFKKSFGLTPQSYRHKEKGEA